MRDSALVLSNLDRHPERFSRRSAGQGAQARKALGEELLPVIRLRDLRHTHATLLRADGVPVEVVSERLGHASATVTLTGHQQVHPAWAGRRPTASRRCSRADPRRGASRGCHAGLRPRQEDTPGS